MSLHDSRSLFDKNHNTIMLVGEITAEQASFFRRQFRLLERSKKFNTITVEINSPGGDIEAGLMIMDTIQLSSKKTVTRVTGQALSMGALVLACGDRREALPNSTIMIHEGSYRISGQHSQLKREYAECLRLELLCYNLLDDLTDKTRGYWKAKCKNENVYLTASQGVEAGLIDKIITKRGRK